MILEQTQKQALIQAAIDARKNSYAPYSHFRVGAALLCADGSVVIGVNVENASFGATICAERSALLAAVSTGKRDFSAIAIVGAPGSLEMPDRLCAPCGICRQVLSEFCPPSFPVLLHDGQKPIETTLGELLPYSFSLPAED